MVVKDKHLQHNCKVPPKLGVTNYLCVWGGGGGGGGHYVPLRLFIVYVFLL